MVIGKRIDLQKIYDNQIKPAEVFDQFIQILDYLETKYSGRAEVVTRNDDKTILFSSSIKYFKFYELGESQKSEVIFAGALEKPPRGGKLPIVRVQNGNRHLPRVPAAYKFPFARDRNPEWTCVVISAETVPLLRELLDCRVEEYFSSP